jgi:hypothetical protein
MRSRHRVSVFMPHPVGCRVVSVVPGTLFTAICSGLLVPRGAAILPRMGSKSRETTLRRFCVLCALLICGTIAVGAENVRADPAHSFLAAAETTPERKFWDAVLERARSCAKAREFSPPALCFLKSTPKKCQSLVYEALLGSDKHKQQPWYLCVISCGDAGWYCRKFGECSRDLSER